MNVKVLLSLIYVIVFNFFILYDVYKEGESVLLNNPTFEIAYNDKTQERYIVLWKKDDKLCMRKIYNEDKKLTIPEENEMCIQEELSDFKYYFRMFESIEIEKPKIEVTITMKVKIPQLIFEFVTLDNGIEYVSKGDIGVDPLYLYQYKIESIGNKTYIVIDENEFIMMSRENIEQSRCVNSVYKNYDGEFWEFIDYRDFENKKLEAESSQNDANNLEKSQ